MSTFFTMLVPIIIGAVALWGMVRKVDVYSALIAGAEEGLGVLIRIVPALVGLLTAVYMLRASGALELAAQALGTEPARIAKTISLHLGEGCLLLLAAGDAKIDNSRFKAEFHTKASMLRGDEVLAMTGYPVGGVCPFANPEGVRVVCDESLRRFDVVYPAAGTPSSAVRLTCEELFRASRAEKWVDVCKGWRPEEQQ